MTSTANGNEAKQEPQIHKGLAGVVVDTTAISIVNADTNSLTYRGYPVQELAADYSFEEVAYLIWHGELPDTDQLAAFAQRERTLRELDANLIAVLDSLPTSCHPMDVLRTAVSYVGASDLAADDSSAEAGRAKALNLFAKLPTIVAYAQRRRQGLPPIAPDPDIGFCENFFHMCFGEIPAPEVVRCFEISMVLYAEHSFNASTFTARVVTSTLSDLYSAVTAAIGALKGPLHGGANEAVMDTLSEIKTAEAVESWLDTALAEKRKIMGFGHRVYKHGDSRVPTMDAALEQLATGRDADELMATYRALREAMLRRKNIHPNLDYPTGPAYHLMGFQTEIFTPLFVMSRITGWTAHIFEQLSANSLIRPLSHYTGPAERHTPAFG